jgi:hypothetical protein
VQTPAIQLSPDAHANAMPQPPQLLLSIIVFTHALPHIVGKELLQELMQPGAPLQVTVPLVGATQAAHVVPHDVREVELSLTHVPLQSCMPAGQVQVELWQTLPPVQAWEVPAVLQAPQLALSVVVSTHALPQSIGNELLPQEPPQPGGAPLQVAVPLVGGTQAAHVVPHDVREVELSRTHVPLQSCMPVGQVQVELWQTLPPVQACDVPAVLQAPQLFMSLLVLTSQPFEPIPSQFA